MVRTAQVVVDVDLDAVAKMVDQRVAQCLEARGTDGVEPLRLVHADLVELRLGLSPSHCLVVVDGKVWPTERIVVEAAVGEFTTLLVRYERETTAEDGSIEWAMETVRLVPHELVVKGRP